MICVIVLVIDILRKVSVVVGPCCTGLLNCIDVDVHTVVLLRK